MRIKKIIIPVLLTSVIFTGCHFPWQPVSQEYDEVEEIHTIKADDAASLVGEALSGLGCKSEYTGHKTIGETGYYIFNITKEDTGFASKLAIDDVSGELFMANDEETEILPYTEFELYNADVDENIQWTGEYANEEHTLSIEEGDPGSFEYHFDDEVGFATLETKARAASVFNDKNITFTFTLDGIEVEAENEATGFEGVYTRQ